MFVDDRHAANEVWSRSDQVDNLYVDRMNLLGIKRGSDSYSALSGKTRRFFNQCATGTVSIMILLLLQNWGMWRVWVCPKCNEIDSKSNQYMLPFKTLKA